MDPLEKSMSLIPAELRQEKNDSPLGRALAAWSPPEKNLRYQVLLAGSSWETVPREELKACMTMRCYNQGVLRRDDQGRSVCILIEDAQEGVALKLQFISW